MRSFVIVVCCICSVIFAVSFTACSSAPVEEDEPEVETPQVTEEDLQAIIDDYIEVCEQTCEQSEECIDDTSVYHADPCREDCQANRQLLEMELDDLEGMNKCFEANLATNQCVLELNCGGWETWQDHRGQQDAPAYPCQEATETAHRACFPFVEEFEETTQ